MGELLPALRVAAAVASVPMLAYVIITLVRHFFATERPGFAAGSPEARELAQLRERVARLEQQLVADAAPRAPLPARPDLSLGAADVAAVDAPRPSPTAADARPWPAS